MDPEHGTAGRVVIDAVHPDDDVIGDLGAALREGALVAFPTETVYGLGASIARPDAVRRIFEVKGRPATDPLIVHVPEVAALDGIVDRFPRRAMDLADAFWPGPLTIVLPRGTSVGDEVTAGGPTVGVRVPAHPVAERLLRACGYGVAAPSANRFGRISPTVADDVARDLGPWLGPADVILDAGATPLGIESTVVDLTAGRPTILRHGGVPLEDVVAVLGEVDGMERRVVDDEDRAASPGTSLRHYAPDTPMVLVEGDRVLVDRLIDGLRERGLGAELLDLPASAVDAAPLLYRRLRSADSRGSDLLLAVVLSPEGLGRGVNDRLFRAAHGRVVIDSSPTTMGRLDSLARG